MILMSRHSSKALPSPVEGSSDAYLKTVFNVSPYDVTWCSGCPTPSILNHFCSEVPKRQGFLIPTEPGFSFCSLQAQLRDAREAVRAAGELTTRLHKAEERAQACEVGGTCGRHRPTWLD